MQAVSEPIVNARGVSKTFREGTLQVEVLKSIDFQVGQGELVSIVGASGSGKTTLMHILGGLAEPSTGTVHIDQKDINRLSQKARGELRNHALGFVYQFHHLLAEFSAQENVAMPLLIRRTDPEQAMEQAADILVRVGLGERLGHRPAELSGGERQRAALARALVAKPRCIMADEPTGNLDARTAGSIHDLLVDLNEATGTSLIVVTHDIRLAERMGRMVSLENGRITDR